MFVDAASEAMQDGIPTPVAEREGADSGGCRVLSSLVSHAVVVFCVHALPVVLRLRSKKSDLPSS